MHIKIRTKLMGVAAVPLLLLLVVGALGLRAMGSIASGTEATYVQHVEPIRDLGTVRFELGELRTLFERVLLGRAPQKPDTFGPEIEQRLRASDALLQKYAASAMDSDERATFAPLFATWIAYKASAARALADVEAGQIAKAQREAVGTAAPLGRDLRLALTDLIAIDDAHAKEHIEDVRGLYGSSRLLILAAVLLALLLGVLASVLTARKAERSIGAMVDAAERIGAGDLTGVVEIESNDELGHIAAALERMRQNLTGTLASVASSASALTQVAMELRASAREGAAATTEQSAALAQTSATVAQLAATANSIADYSRRVANGAEETGETMQAMLEGVDTIATRSIRLGERAQKIGQILDVMDGIAEQTNLLALNAAIEAARAGDAGRGFAVVAGEVRKLAERSIGSAESIRDIVASLRDETNATIMATEDGTKNAREVGELMNATSSMLEESLLATQQQKSAADQVSIALVQIRDAAGQLAADQAQRAQSSEQLEALATGLQVALLPFAIDADGLRSDAP